jgi:hypothetical protein
VTLENSSGYLPGVPWLDVNRQQESIPQRTTLNSAQNSQHVRTFGGTHTNDLDGTYEGLLFKLLCLNWFPRRSRGPTTLQNGNCNIRLFLTPVCLIDLEIYVQESMVGPLTSFRRRGRHNRRNLTTANSLRSFRRWLFPEGLTRRGSPLFGAGAWDTLAAPESASLSLTRNASIDKLSLS